MTDIPLPMERTRPASGPGGSNSRHWSKITPERVGDIAVIDSWLLVVSTKPRSLPEVVKAPLGSGATDTKMSLNKLPVVSSNESIVAPEPPGPPLPPPPGGTYTARTLIGDEATVTNGGGVVLSKET